MGDSEQQGDTGAVPDCLFCRIVAGGLPADVVHSTDTTLAFKDIAPAAPLHVLVVPRRHITDASQIATTDGPVPWPRPPGWPAPTGATGSSSTSGPMP